MTPTDTWNVYMVMEDGESRIFAARTMGGAVESAWGQALAAETERRGVPLSETEALEERRDWETGVLQSCTLVGELENVDELRLATERPGRSA